MAGNIFLVQLVFRQAVPSGISRRHILTTKSLFHCLLKFLISIILSADARYNFIVEYMYLFVFKYSRNFNFLTFFLWSNTQNWLLLSETLHSCIVSILVTQYIKTVKNSVKALVFSRTIFSVIAIKVMIQAIHSTNAMHHG